MVCHSTPDVQIVNTGLLFWYQRSVVPKSGDCTIKRPILSVDFFADYYHRMSELSELVSVFVCVFFLSLDLNDFFGLLSHNYKVLFLCP